MSWNSTLPPRSLDGYHTALSCYLANEVAHIVAEKAGDQAASHHYELGSEKSWIFARRTAEQLGLIESNHDASDSVELKKLVHDESYRREALARCRQGGLAFDDFGGAPPSDNSGPDRDRTQDAIDRKFIRWSENWAVDIYLKGTTHIDRMNCGADGCEAVGHFSFSRGGAVLTIQFTAQIASVGQNEYALGRLCYSDNTTGMRDCAD